MNSPAQKLPWTIGIGLLLLFFTLALVFLVAQLKARTVQKRAVLPVIGDVAEFTLTNQNGKAVSLADLRGNVWVADIIFTRCPGPCLRMTHQMQELDAALPPTTRLVSLTTDPNHDTPEVLKAHARLFDAKSERWMFLTGTKTTIANLAVDSLKLTALEKDPAQRESVNDLFIHSTMFVLVDKQARLRGVFETTGEGVDWPTSKTRILAAVRQLEREK